MVPPWTRVYRVQRDIPMPLVTSGVEKGNLRELALAWMEDLGLKCRDVRTLRGWNSGFDLQVEQGMKFGLLYTPGEFPLPSETRSAEFYKMVPRMLSDAGYNL
ncbi:hypothetical protein ACFXTH_038826 [Malus domestica]